MALNILNIFKEYFTPEVISKASTFVGENAGQTAKAADSIVAIVLAGLLNKAQDEDGLAIVSDIIAAHNGSILNNVLNVFNGGEQTDSIIRSGAVALTNIFGQNKSIEIATVVTDQSGVQISGAGKLLNLLTPILLGIIGKQIANSESKALAVLLLEQKNLITNQPADVANLLGVENLSELGNNLAAFTGVSISSLTSTVTNTNANSSAQTAVEESTKKSDLLKWSITVGIIIIAIIAIIFGVRSCK